MSLARPAVRPLRTRLVIGASVDRDRQLDSPRLARGIPRHPRGSAILAASYIGVMFGCFQMGAALPCLIARSTEDPNDHSHRHFWLEL
jgi:hypothetical protein